MLERDKTIWHRNPLYYPGMISFNAQISVFMANKGNNRKLNCFSLWCSLVCVELTVKVKQFKTPFNQLRQSEDIN